METSKDEKRSRMSGILTVFVDDAPIRQKGALLLGKSWTSLYMDGTAVNFF